MNSFTPFAIKWERGNILKLIAYNELKEQQCRSLEKHTNISTKKTLNIPKCQINLGTNSSNRKKVRFQIQTTEALPERTQQISTQTSVSASFEKCSLLYKESITTPCVNQTYENKHQLDSKKSNQKKVRFQALSERTQQIFSATSKSFGDISPCSKKCSVLCKKTLTTPFDVKYNVNKSNENKIQLETKKSDVNKARSQMEAPKTLGKTTSQQISSATNCSLITQKSITASSDKYSQIYKKSANTPTDIICSFNNTNVSQTQIDNSTSLKMKVEFNRIELLYHLLTKHHQKKKPVQQQRFGSTRRCVEC